MVIVLSACGGGGGGSSSVPFSISVSSFSFNVDEDESYSGTLTATKNETTTVTFELTTSPSNGTLSFGSTGSYTYRPTSNFNGTDSFKYRAYATPQNKYSAEGTATITINAVDDPPVLTLSDLPGKNSILFREDNGLVTFTGSVSDVDNDFIDLSFSSTFNGQDASVTAENETSLTISIDVSSIIDASRFNIEIKACSGAESSLSCDSEAFDTYLASGYKDDGTYISYNLLGSYEAGSLNPRYLDMMVMADSLGTVSGPESATRSQFRQTLLDSINNLIDGTVSDYFDGFFNVMVVEPSNPNLISLVDLTADGERSDDLEGIYCWDSAKVSQIQESLFPESFMRITAILASKEGRGVYSPSTLTFGSPIRARRAINTFIHEFGHAHARFGDEYDSEGESERYTENQIKINSAFDPNVTINSDPQVAAWKHQITDMNNIPGYDLTAGNNGVGFFEGMYYQEEGGYRPQGDSIMNSGSRCEELGLCPNGDTATYRDTLADFTNVHAEIFAISTLHDLVVDIWNDASFTTSDDSIRTAISISPGLFEGAVIDSSKYEVEWYVDGIKDSSLTGTYLAKFERPSTDEWKIYSWKLKDKTGLITAPDNILDHSDSYGDSFGNYRDWSYSDEVTEHFAYIVGDPGDGWVQLPYPDLDQDYPNHSYLYTRSTASGTLAINWRQW